MSNLAPQIRQIASALLKQALATAQGSVELMHSFARPLALQATCGLLLGIDSQREAWIVEWLETHPSAILRDPAGMVERFRGWLQVRRQEPGHGLADEMIAAHDRGELIDGQPMTEWDLIGYLWALLVSGYESTGSSIGNVLLAFVQHGVLEELRAYPERIPRAMEEGLRWRVSFPLMTVGVQQTTQLASQEIPAGAHLLLWLSAANHDRSVFEQPEVFDVERTPNPHLTFGYGKHYCLGAPLARLILSVAIETFLEHIPLPVRLRAEQPVSTMFTGLDESLLELHLVYGAEAEDKSQQ